jgi:endonuclease/exonuclease/phosphatase family metal-dependent hydrolase
MIRLVSLNVERSKHMELVLPFLKAAHADVVCLVELMEHDIEPIRAAAGEHFLFEPMCRVEYPGEKPGIQGIGIFSRTPLENARALYYRGDRAVLKTYHHETRHATNRHMLLAAEVRSGGEAYRIGTTHFPVTPRGFADEHQRHDAAALLDILKSQGEIIFCGDLNAPRGDEIYKQLAAELKDNVPPEYTMSLDIKFHRAGAEALAESARAMGLPGQMVDYIFSTPGYAVSDVEMIGGLSDHKALVANVSKS